MMANTPNGDGILRMKQLASSETAQGYLPLSRTNIYDMMDPRKKNYDPSFPRPVQLGTRAVGWKKAEIDVWLTTRPLVQRGDGADQHNKSDKPQIAETLRISKTGADLMEAPGSRNVRDPKHRTPARQDNAPSQSPVAMPDEIQIVDAPCISGKELSAAADLEKTRIATVRQILEENARKGTRISYQEVMAPIRLWADLPADREVIDIILADITKASHAENKGLLGVLVNEAIPGKYHPSAAFFELAKSLGYKFDNQIVFVQNQRERLFEAYEDPTKKSKGRLVWIQYRNKTVLMRKS